MCNSLLSMRRLSRTGGESHREVRTYGCAQLVSAGVAEFDSRLRLHKPSGALVHLPVRLPVLLISVVYLRHTVQYPNPVKWAKSNVRTTGEIQTRDRYRCRSGIGFRHHLFRIMERGKRYNMLSSDSGCRWTRSCTSNPTFTFVTWSIQTPLLPFASIAESVRGAC